MPNHESIQRIPCAPIFGTRQSHGTFTKRQIPDNDLCEQRLGPLIEPVG